VSDNQDSSSADQSDKTTVANAAWASIKERWRRQVRDVPIDENSRLLAQRVTWGLAGVAVLFIASIVGGNLQSAGARVALSLFAISVPLLVLSGVLFQWSTDPAHEPPEVGWVIKTGAIWLAALLAVGGGMFVLLMTYNTAVGILFASAMVFAYRTYLRFAKHLKRKSGAVEPVAPTIVAATSEPAQVTAAEPIGTNASAERDMQTAREK
jgi:hypothetical protein